MIALLGESGCGKSSVARLLSERYGWKVLKSYTDRPRRGPNDNDHIFLTPAAYDIIPINDKIAETTFNGHRYCATIDQANDSQIYIIDPAGYCELIKHYKDVVPIYIAAYPQVRYSRMIARGDSESDALLRLHHDIGAFLHAFEIPGLTVVDGNIELDELADSIEGVVLNEQKKKGDGSTQNLLH